MNRLAALRTGLLTGTLALLVGACASTENAVPVERLDKETGITLIRLGRPVEFIATVARSEGADPFAFAAPLITNRMGARAYFMWLGVPGDTPLGQGTPQLYCDETPIVMQRQIASAPESLATRPYDRPTPWTADYYFEIDAPTLTGLDSCQQLAITVTYEKAGDVRFKSNDHAAPHAFAELGRG